MFDVLRIGCSLTRMRLLMPNHRSQLTRHERRAAERKRVCRAWHVTMSVRVQQSGLRPERRLNERKSHLLRNDDIASGESIGCKLGGWDEADVGAVGNDAPVVAHGWHAVHSDSICRTAVCDTRLYGAWQGRAVRLLPIPNRPYGTQLRATHRAEPN